VALARKIRMGEQSTSTTWVIAFFGKNSSCLECWWQNTHPKKVYIIKVSYIVKH